MADYDSEDGGDHNRAVFDLDLSGIMDSGEESVAASEGFVEDFNSESDEELVQSLEAVESKKVDGAYRPNVVDISEDEDVDVEDFFEGVPLGNSSQKWVGPVASQSGSSVDGKKISDKKTTQGGASRIVGAMKNILGPARYKAPKSALEMEDLTTVKYAVTSEKKVKWAVKAYNDWRDTAIETHGAEFIDSDVLACDLAHPGNLEKERFCAAMCKFITEVRKCDAEDYPPNTVKEMVLCIQMHLRKHKIMWKIMTLQDPAFCNLYFVVDNIMKERTAAGMGVVQSATPISNAMEDKMWKEGLLGEDNPKLLCETVLFLNGVNFALRGGVEHKKLRRPGFNPQIVVTTDSEGMKCLKFTEDPHSKTNQGGLGRKSFKPRVVHVYPISDHTRCHVRLYEKYVGLIPPNGKSKSLYLHAKRKTTPGQWYDDRCWGINYIGPVVKKLCKAAGFENGVFRNQSLRASGITRLFRNGTDEQVIKDFSGHRSNAVRSYKHIDDKIRQQTSAIITGQQAKLKGDVAETVSKVESETESEDDFVKIGEKIRARGQKRRCRDDSVEKVESSNSKNVCKMISDLSENRKFKKIRVKIEFLDTE